MNRSGEEIEHEVRNAAERNPNQQHINREHMQTEQHLILEEQVVCHDIARHHRQEDQQPVERFCRAGEQLE